MVKPLKDNVLIKEDALDEMTKGGIILPDDAKEKHNSGVVMEVGSEVEDVVVGDRVLYGAFAGNEIVVDGQPMLLVRESEVMALVVNE